MLHITRSGQFAHRVKLVRRPTTAPLLIVLAGSLILTTGWQGDQGTDAVSPASTVVSTPPVLTVEPRVTVEPGAQIPAVPSPGGSGPLSTGATDAQPDYGRVGRYRLASGAVIDVSVFYSPALGRTMPYAVMLPPGYDQSTRPYAVLTMLHGLAGGYGSWIELGLPAVFEALYASGSIDPFIIAFVEGEAGYYVNHADGGPRWGDYVAVDFVEHIDLIYRTIGSPESRAIGGLSMGGEGALQLAINYPGVFGAVGAHTPTTRLSYEDSPGTIYGDETYWQEHNSLWLIRNVDAIGNLEIWIDDGYDDVWLPSAEALHAALLARGIPHQYHVFAGSHDYWDEVLDDYLRFYSGAMDTGGPDPTQPSGLRRRAGRPASVQ
ncbi:MAG: hypothetical protein IT307_13160 [Chloroflexi bacterium]|nr:hypothetical protein [Chloroflexota bacterium]